MMKKELKIKELIPAKSWNYMYAITNGGNYFIYAHSKRVAFFGTMEARGISRFQDTVTKLYSLKFFNEKSDKNLVNIVDVDFNKSIDRNFKIGTCLVFLSFKTNYKADIWIDNLNHEVVLKIYDAGDFAHGHIPDIQLPDEDEKQESSFIDAMSAHDKNLVTLIFEQPIFFQKLISYGYPFTSDQIVKYLDMIDWKEFSRNPKFIWSIDLINQYKKFLDWYVFSKHHSWTSKLINEFKSWINWSAISDNVSFPWTKDNIVKYQSKICWLYLSSNGAAEFDIEILREFESKIDWNSLASNPGKWWSIEIINEFKERFNWDTLCRRGTFWTLDYIKYFEKDLMIDYRLKELCQNTKITWNEDLLNKYESKLAWGHLSERDGMPWSFKLIEKYNDKWNWSRLGRIIWDSDFAEKHINDFFLMSGENSLCHNKILIASEEFCLKHKDVLFDKDREARDLLFRGSDASYVETLPVSIDFFYKLKDYLDWDGFLFEMLKKTGKFEILTKEITIEILDKLIDTKHFDTTRKA